MQYLPLELIVSLLVQFIGFVAFLASLHWKVKFLEADVKELQIAMKEGHEQHKLIAKIDGKLDLLISQMTQK